MPQTQTLGGPEAGCLPTGIRCYPENCRAKRWRHSALGLRRQLALSAKGTVRGAFPKCWACRDDSRVEARTREQH